MKRELKKFETFYIKNKRVIKGIPPNVSGDITGVYGDLTGISGSLTGIYGDLTGIRGDLTDIGGDLDQCGITPADREEGIDINELVKKRGEGEDIKNEI